MNFLLEIGTEEIPASYLKPYSNQLRDLFTRGIAKQEVKTREDTEETAHEAPCPEVQGNRRRVTGPGDCKLQQPVVRGRHEQ